MLALSVATLSPRTPRVSVETLCTEVRNDESHHAIAVDLSPTGLRIQRPFCGGIERTLGIELEVPDVDDLLWLIGAVCYDRVHRLPSIQPGVLGKVVRTTGLRVVSGATRDRNRLREFVLDSVPHAQPDFSLMDASCYRRG